MASGPAALVSSTRANTNYARLCRLLIDIGTDVLRNIFNEFYPPRKLRKILSRHSEQYGKLKQLKIKGVLNPISWEKLSTLSSAKFDIALLLVLLRNICGLGPPASTGSWNKPPLADDDSREANMVRIKFIRNEVQGHAIKASVDDSKFNKLWKEISEVIIGLASRKNKASYTQAISKLKNVCMDPDAEARYLRLLDDWKKYDDDTRKKLKGMMQNF